MAGDDDQKNSGAENDATVFVPFEGLTPAGEPATPTSLRPAAIPVGGIDPGQYRQIQIGDVLNHIFEVKRFIARGGMGEVFEGINVNSEERVAIKVMLPSLAADANLLAMFRKEARTLTRLNHPALVQYRVLAQEPQLGVFYIVTEFVDGDNLSDVISDLRPSPQDLIKLIRRLAGGLDAAHALGAIHRDMSPDNVMLEGGQLSGARIIDFGIAKDLTAGAATIIGDGFAGKLNYVAPEQLGDFDRSIGPWTDVYSLGLVILATAMGKNVDMGGTLVNAVDKRRSGPDLSGAPEELQPLLAQMLKPNPEERLRSMGAVLDLLPATTVSPQSAAAEVGEEAAQPSAKAKKPVDLGEPVQAQQPVSTPPSATQPPMPTSMPPASGSPPPEPSAAPVIEPMFSAEPPASVAAMAWQTPPQTTPVSMIETSPPPGPATTAKPQATPTPPAAKAAKPAASRKVPLPLIIVGGGVALALVAAAGLWYVWGRGAGPDPGLQVAARPAAGNVADTRAALDAGLGSLGCTWLDVADVSRRGNGIVAALRGVAGNPDDAKAQIGKILAAKNQNGVTVDFRDVAPIEASECGPLDALRQIRDAQGGRISVPTRQFEITKQPGGAPGAKAIVNFNFGDPNLEMALFGVEPSGTISQLTSERAELVGGSEDLGNNQYRLSIDVTHTGWSGLLLLTGQKPFEGSLLTGPAGSRTGDWSDRFLKAARERGWKSEMVWFKTVDDQPDLESAPPPP
jgi:serine/threonine protein kinase